MPHPVDLHVGKKLKELRALHRVSQTDLAKKFNLTFQQIQKYEIASNRISASRLYDLSKVFGVPPAYFFEGLDTPGDALGKLSVELENSLDSIQDEASKERVRKLVEDLSGIKSKDS